MVVGELHTLTHLVELPARGVGADLIGRAGALLVDIGIDTVPRGYRIAPGRSSVVRRAVSLLDEDVDALEEAWEKAGLRGGGRGPSRCRRPVRSRWRRTSNWPTDTARSPTPVRCATWRASPRRGRCAAPRRDRASARDAGRGAVRRAVAARRAGGPADRGDRASRRCIRSTRRWRSGLLDECVETVGGEVALHCCAPDLPWKMLQRSAFSAVSVDVATLTAADSRRHRRVRRIGPRRDARGGPVQAPDRRPSAEEVAKVGGVDHRPTRLPPCGAARPDRRHAGVRPRGATAQWARTAIELAQKVADAIAEDPARDLE